mgnify:CR=1 FL=1
MSLPVFTSIEACIKHLQALPPDGEPIDIDLDADLIKYLDEKAQEFHCTVELIIAAIITMHHQEVTGN